MKAIPFFKMLQLGDTTVSFNCPPEILKRLKVEEADIKRELGLAGDAKLPNPTVIVLGDTATHNLTPLASPEFPVLYQMFLNGGFDWKTSTMVKPIYLVGEKRRVDAHLKALYLAVTGPTGSDFKKAGVSRGLRQMLERESNHLALKRNGEVLPIEEFCRPVYFENYSKEGGTAQIKDLGIEVLHLGMDEYEISRGETRQSVKLTSEGVLEPSWALPELHSVEIPHEFRMFVLGSDSGFGPGPTTGYLFDFGGEYVMYDCHAYVSRTLLHNGITPGQIRKIVISHVHDDHANDLMPFALNQTRKVEILATREVSYALKLKLAALWDWPVERVEKYFRWKDLSAGSGFAPINLFGYEFSSFYGLHPIPSIGMTIRRKGQHVLTVSGDTGTKGLLDTALKAEVISEERYRFLCGLPALGWCFIDAGEASIHGMLKDLEAFDASKIFTYHRWSLPADMAEKFSCVKPGDFYPPTTQEIRHSDSSVVAAVLQRIGVREAAAWSTNLISEGVIQKHPRNTVIVQKDSNQLDNVYMIAHGLVDVIIDGNVVTTLGKGDLFGEQAILDAHQVRARNATIFSRSPVRLIALPSKLFATMIEEDRELALELGEDNDSAIARFTRAWRNRAVISGVREFNHLGASLKHDLSVQVESREFNPGDLIIAKGSTLQEAYIVAVGSVEVVLDKANVKNPILKPFALFGENVPLGFAKSRTADVRAYEHCTVLVLKGRDIKRFFNVVPGVRFAIEETAIERGQSIKVEKAA